MLGWGLAGLTRFWRALCRYRYLDDPRPALRAAGTPYVYALLHAHQITGLFACDEPRGGLATMVSNSPDGELVMPCVRACGVRVVRGSSGPLDKHGPRALAELRAGMERGVPVLLTVDGPRGPRNRVKRGVVVLARSVPGAVVLPLAVVPSRRWVVSGSWGRLQIPLPFARVLVRFAAPLRPAAGEDAESLRLRIEAELNRLERDCDPEQADAAPSPAAPPPPVLPRSA